MRKLLAMVFVGVFALMVGMNAAYAFPGHSGDGGNNGNHNGGQAGQHHGGGDGGRGNGHHGHGHGHDNGGHDGGGCPNNNGDNDTPSDSKIDTPKDTAVVSGETVGLPDMVSCDTDWERATYRECFGLPYDLLLQDKDLLGVDYAVPATRIGFDQ